MKNLISLIVLLFTMNLSAQELFVAYENEDYKKLKELLENGADPNQINESNGMTLMFNTAWDNNLEIAQLLFLHGGKVDMKSSKNDVTPLLPACQENSFDIVKFFVENGANANQKYKVAGNQTPIRFACKTGNIELVEYLINNGAKIEDNPDDGITPLIQASRSNHYDLVKFLIEKGANVNAYARDKEFALNQAIKNGNYDIAKLLIDNGAKLTFEDKDGHSSLKLAKKSKDKKLIKLIKENLN
jgi:ankyrin repeat protein